MNQVFLEERSKEKVKELLNEGVRSQEYYRNRASKPNPFHRFGRSIFAILKTVIHYPIPEKKHPVNSHPHT